MAEATPSLGNLEVTSTWTAAVRAAESERGDALFSDPWAAALAGPEGQAWLAERTPESVLPIALRTRFFDDFILRVMDEDCIRQVVIMAAGLDTRAYRLDMPGTTRVFELDRAEVLDRKQRILDAAGAQPVCERVPIPVDLSGDWPAALTAAGLDDRQPAVWLLEGFLFYLPEDELLQFLDGVMKHVSDGSWVGFDMINGETLTSPFTQPWVEMQARMGAPWLGAIDDPSRYLARHRVKATLTQFGEESADFGRWSSPVIPREQRGVPRFWLTTGRKPYRPRTQDETQQPMMGQAPRPGIEGLPLIRRSPSS